MRVASRRARLLSCRRRRRVHHDARHAHRLLLHLPRPRRPGSQTRPTLTAAAVLRHSLSRPACAARSLRRSWPCQNAAAGTATRGLGRRGAARGDLCLGKTAARPRSVRRQASRGAQPCSCIRIGDPPEDELCAAACWGEEMSSAQRSLAAAAERGRSTYALRLRLAPRIGCRPHRRCGRCRHAPRYRQLQSSHFLHLPAAAPHAHAEAGFPVCMALCCGIPTRTTACSRHCHLAAACAALHLLCPLAAAAAPTLVQGAAVRSFRRL
jgi:hypothetical protein